MQKDNPTGIRANIYRCSHGSCAPTGISESHQRVTVIGDNIAGPFEPNADAPAVKLVVRNLYGKRVIHAEPVAPGHYMFGGCYIATSDSRFSEATGFYGAVALHDRSE